jgi:hypothetical protein
MKTLILAACFTTCAASVFAQGTIVFGNNLPNSVVAPIYSPDPANPSLVNYGNDPFGYPPGLNNYGGHLLTAADQVTVQLWGGPNASSLAPVPNAEATIVAEGLFATASAPVAVPGVPGGGTAQLQLRAWQNKDGTIMTWEAAIGAGVDLGESAVFMSQPLGGGITPAPNLVGLFTFNIHTPIPEPSTFALAALGAALLLIFRPGGSKAAQPR